MERRSEDRAEVREGFGNRYPMLFFVPLAEDDCLFQVFLRASEPFRADLGNPLLLQRLDVFGIGGENKVQQLNGLVIPLLPIQFKCLLAEVVLAIWEGRPPACVWSLRTQKV